MGSKWDRLEIRSLDDVSAFLIEITAADVSGSTAYHTFYVVATAGCKVYWGDGSYSTLSTGTNTCTHTYSRAGQYLIQIRGAHTWFYHTTPGTGSKVLEGIKLYSGVTTCNYMWTCCTNPNFILRKSFVVTSRVTSIYGMLRLAGSFNSDISHWDMSNVHSFGYALDSAYHFNQSLAAWDISSMTSALYMLNNTSLSSANYDAILNSWAAQSVQSNVTFRASPAKYTSAGAAARAVLTGTYGWTITDGGLAS